MTLYYVASDRERRGGTRANDVTSATCAGEYATEAEAVAECSARWYWLWPNNLYIARDGEPWVKVCDLLGYREAQKLEMRELAETEGLCE
jgi:hypothetical protein